MKISIIVPVYNVEDYLNECVESLLRQTYGNIEVILVDDGSPDHCGKMCDQYAQKDSRIVVMHQKNAGLSCARNAGIEKATGDYLCFVDSDDYVTDDYCETLYGLLKDTECDFAVGGVHRFDNRGRVQLNRDVNNYTSEQYTNEEFLYRQLLKNLNLEYVINYIEEMYLIICDFLPGKYMKMYYGHAN